MNSIAQSVKRPVFAVKFWFGRYDPTAAFDVLTAGDIPLEAKSRDGRVWEAARPGATLEDVRNYMVLQGWRVLNYDKVAERRRAGHWQGLYAVFMGPQVEVAHANHH